MAAARAFADEDHGLGDVGALVADPLERVGDEADLHGAFHGPGLVAHVFGHFLEDGDVELQDVLGFLAHAAGDIHVELGEAGGRARQEFARGLGQFLEPRRRGQGIVRDEPQPAMGDAHGLIADALDIPHRAHAAEDVAQVPGHGLVQGEQAQDLGVQGAFQGVDGRVRGDDRAGRFGVARKDRAQGFLHGDLGHVKGRQHIRLEFLQVRLDDPFHAAPPLAFHACAMTAKRIQRPHIWQEFPQIVTKRGGRKCRGRRTTVS